MAHRLHFQLKALFGLLGMVLFSSCAFANLDASEPMKPGLYTGVSASHVSLSDLAGQVSPGTIVIVSEHHTNQVHHLNQAQWIKALGQRGLSVSVGMEFFYWPQQVLVDQYLLGEISEDDFLTQMNWGGLPFSFYREMVLAPLQFGGSTRALNAPPELTSEIKKVGVAQLPEPLKDLMPPRFELGNAAYYERFKEAMQHHIPEAKVPLYFASQSTWDETMAWQAIEHMQAHPEDVLVIIVGDFHAAFGGGLPDRIRARGFDKLMVISQVNGYGLNDQEIIKLMAPSPDYGPRADYVWLSYYSEESKGGKQ